MSLAAGQFAAEQTGDAVAAAVAPDLPSGSTAAANWNYPSATVAEKRNTGAGVVDQTVAVPAALSGCVAALLSIAGDWDFVADNDVDSVQLVVVVDST